MLKFQNTSTKLQINSNFEISMTESMLGSLELGAWYFLTYKTLLYLNIPEIFPYRFMSHNNRS
jgi:hypothetical protein